jgi:hypothetical protein
MRVRCRHWWVSRLVAMGLALGLLGVFPSACGSSTTSSASAATAFTGTTTTSLATTTTAIATTSTGSTSGTTTRTTTDAVPSTGAVPSTTTQPVTTLEYRNTEYDFSFSLPMSWQGYSIVVSTWEGFPNDTNGGGSSGSPVYGPEILIRHPLWTSMNPRQDIPIMVFTIAQWDLVQQEELTVGAAPIGPSELGRNAEYVFALPARYDYAFPTGYEEVEKILEGKPLQAF